MTSRYQGLQWGTKSGDYPIVIEAFNVFKDQDAGKSAKRGSKIRVLRAPFIRFAVSKDALHAIKLYPDYTYKIVNKIPVIVADIGYLLATPMSSHAGDYIQLIVNEDRSMRAKVRTASKTYVFEYRLETEQWHALYVDPSKPWNW
jgi:hypothetical protein